MPYARVEQTAIDKWEEVIVESTHSTVQGGIGVSRKVAFDVTEQLKHKRATVGCQGGVGAVKQSAGQIGRERKKQLKVFWNERERGKAERIFKN